MKTGTEAHSLKAQSLKAQSLKFDTELGEFTMHFSARGVTSLRLSGPGRGAAAAEGGGSPAWAREAAARIQKHLGGELQDLSKIPVDLSGCTPFFRCVYEHARSIQPGRTLSYGELASQAGSPGAARAVGQAMRRNPVPLLVPCHRVLGSKSAPGGFSLGDGVTTKRRLLSLEGVRI